MAVAIRELTRRQDVRAAGGFFHSPEKGTLARTVTSFPFFEGKYFHQQVEASGKGGSARIFEVGGGSQQTIAREILRNNGDGISHYVGFEIAPISYVAESDLIQYPQFKLVRGVIGKLDPEAVGKERFDLAFAHDVALELPDPIDLVKKLHETVKKGGLVYINGILLDEVVVSDLVRAWGRRGLEYTVRQSVLGDDLRKAGIAKVDLVVRKKDDELPLPYVTEDAVLDARGVAHASRRYSRSLMHPWEVRKGEIAVYSKSRFDFPPDGSQ